MKKTIIAITAGLLHACSSVPHEVDPSSMSRIKADPEICFNKDLINGTDSTSVRLHNTCLAYRGVPPPVIEGPTPGELLTTVAMVGAVALAAPVVMGVAAAAAEGPTITTTYKRDRNGQLGRVSNRYYDSRIRYNRDGSIREIKTRVK